MTLQVNADYGVKLIFTHAKQHLVAAMKHHWEKVDESDNEAGWKIKYGSLSSGKSILVELSVQEKGEPGYSLLSIGYGKKE